MKKLLAVALMSLGLTGFSFAEGVEGNAADGQAKAGACGGCHGMDGNSGIASNPKLAGQNEKYLIKQINDIKNGDRTVIPMTGMLNSVTDQDIADIAAYFSSKTAQGGVAKKDLVELGESLYRGGNMETGVASCMGCHSPTGAGNPAAGFPALSGQHADYVVAQLKAFRVAERSNDPSEMMQNIASKLTDAEIEAVASYISGLH